MTFRTDRDLAGTVSRLFIHPVKSCAGIAVPEALLTPTGLEWDRTWMVVDARGDFVTQRTAPRMALVSPELQAPDLVLRAPDMPALQLALHAMGPVMEVRVWDDAVPAWDVGDQAARWFTAFLRQPCRLVRFDPAHRRLSSLRRTGGIEAPNQFADAYPVLLTSEASLRELNERLGTAGASAVDMDRFRANIVIDGVESHDEDRIDSLFIDTGGEGSCLKPVKPCTRCPIPDIDPLTALSSPEVSTALRAYRQDARVNGAITFGMNSIVLEGAGRLVRVGQRVSADWQFD
ncbi:MOSC domain-containing protein [Acidovorax sp. NCPPB 4044]|uniref:MOSC domain-containing protein n=1 Tax=Acidovorax sp. NCPPB 4044 TaxID=2940490 RepID=UPI002303A469|nr:MOSC N-terminal beta barrel domain-containing protein [Acidovorax sp. NCPPB 4044]MDA8519368.1 MOSC N-terminal beta barrel domain-containing protein [Acidovorax sp. NCPPB 4044]